jgi:hypothetical protein
VKSKSFAFFHRDYLLKERLREEARNFHLEPRGKQILEVFRMTDIAPSQVEDLTQFDDFYRTYLQLKKQYTSQ